MQNHIKHLSDLYLHIKESERGRLFIFLVIIFGCGIGSYFSLTTEPDYSKTLMATLVCLIVFILSFYSRKWVLYPSLFLLTFALGFMIANSRAISIDAPKIENNLGTVWLRGKLEDIDKKENFYRIIISEPDLWQPEKGKFQYNETPKKIRLNVRTKIDSDVSEGDIIKAKAKLSPPSELPVYPNGYDFAKYSYFNKIGAVGFTLSDVKIFDDKSISFIKNLRNKINFNIEKNVENFDNAEILKALITAERGGINKDLKETIRNSGLGHILAISGMHMGIACIWFFTVFRLILAFIPSVPLKYDTKKIASCFALMLGLFYLMITQMPISATRAYIMIALFLLAILIDRQNQPMRPIALAAFIILIFQPESLITPGFQMSFAAVIGLVGTYEIIFRSGFLMSTYSDKIHKKFMIYFLGICVTTIIAGIATSPFAVYHFGKIPKYSIISNLVAIPALTFITLPTLFLSTLLMPLGLEAYTLWLAEFGVNIIKYIAEYTSSIEGNLITKPSMPSWFLWLATLPFLWLFAFKSRIRYFSIPLIISSYLVMTFYNNTPDLIIDAEMKNFAVKQKDGNYLFYGRKNKGYKISRWAEQLGIKEEEVIFTTKEQRQYCDIEDCELKFIKIDKEFNKKDCNKYRFIILNSYHFGQCKDDEAIIFNKYSLAHSGTLLLYRNGNFITSRSQSGYRLWNK